MIGKPGSTLWLLGNEMRLGWRDMLGRRGAVRGMILAGVLIAGAVSLGSWLGWNLRHSDIPMNPLVAAVADGVCILVFTLMLSQTLFAATQALYARGDLELLFSSPIAPRRVLTVRFAAIALNVFSAFAVLVAPVLAPIAIFGHWRWLSALLVLAALALSASAAGLLLAVGLFRLIGPRRTRTVAQILAAFIGAAFFLVSQTARIAGGRDNAGWLEWIKPFATGGLTLPPGADWPLRAMVGAPGPLVVIVGGAAALFLLSNQWLGARFADDAAAASGADVGGPKPAAGRAGSIATFAAGAFAATYRKEMRLLRRDAALLSQVFLRVLYLLPVSFIVLRNAGAHATYALPGGAAAIAFLAGQVSGSLTWITVSAEDAPDLLACGPAPISTLMRAKLAAALTPVAALLVVPLVALTVIAPAAGIAATLGSAACALASGLINVWYLRPGKRADFRRRRGGSWITALAQAGVTLLIGGAVYLTAMLSPFALIPAGLAVIALFALRRSDTQIAAALRAAT